MRIQHNIMALNASNRLKSNDSAISSNIAKLSSGYRINSAADDAAGLAVSEKMRSQINGLTQAEDNAQNGISLVQTAEGGLNETSSILQRMNTLAVESANGTYQNDTDRANLQKEVTALQSEIDTISTSTNFNQINLLDGSLQASSATVSVPGATLTNNAATSGTFTVGTSGSPASLGDSAATAVGNSNTYTISYKNADGTSNSVALKVTLTTKGTDASTASVYTITNGTNTVGTYTTTVAAGTPTSTDWDDALAYGINNDSTLSGAFTATNDSGNSEAITLTAKTAGTSGEKLVGLTDGASSQAFVSTSGVDAYQSATFTNANIYDGTDAKATSSVFTVNGQKFAFANSGTDVSKLGTDVNVVYVAASGTMAASDVTSMSNLINAKTGLATDDVTDAAPTTATTTMRFKAAAGTNGALTMQVGSDNKADQRVSLSIKDMSSKGLGIQDVSVATQADAESAIDTIKSAINTVDGTRADLGALQNQLEHTSNNLSTMSENLTSAESQIRDVDMSDEYVQYSKNQILSQAATAMLAQANTAPQNVLTLLKG